MEKKKSWEKDTYWSWKVLEGSKENQHRDRGIVGVNVNFRALEKSIWVLTICQNNPVGTSFD